MIIRVLRLSILAGAAALALAAAGDRPVATAPPSDAGQWTYECLCVAHGSKADHGSAASRNAKPNNPGGGKGGGGGGKTKDCFKTFGSWSGGDITYHVDDSGAPSGFGTVLTDYVENSIGEWSCHSGLGDGVTITEVANAADADIAVSWGDLGTSGTLGRTSASLSGGTFLWATIVMNNNNQAFTWTLGAAPNPDANGCNVDESDGNGSSYDLLSVTIHEFGHALGVDHPTKRCNVRDACYPETMFPCTGPAEFSRRTLHTGDQAAGVSLYGADQ